MLIKVTAGVLCVVFVAFFWGCIVANCISLFDKTRCECHEITICFCNYEECECVGCRVN